jgi:hypothetical protein
VTAGHRGCSNKERLFKVFLGPTSPVEVHREPRHQETALEHRSLKDVPGAPRKRESNGRFLPETGHLRGLARLGNLASLITDWHRRARKGISFSILHLNVLHRN